MYAKSPCCHELVFERHPRGDVVEEVCWSCGKVLSSTSIKTLRRVVYAIVEQNKQGGAKWLIS